MRRSSDWRHSKRARSPVGFSSELASAELYDVGLGFSGAWQPQISTAAFNADGKLVLTGTGLRGISSGSGGNGAQDSPTNCPVVQLRRLDNGVKETTNLLLSFADFPMNAPGTDTFINAQGKLEFEFTVPDNTAFFRLEAQ